MNPLDIEIDEVKEHKTNWKSIQTYLNELNNVKISAQEAVYITLQLPMRKSSCQIVFINTSPPEDRVQLLKPLKDINEMEDDSQLFKRSDRP